MTETLRKMVEAMENELVRQVRDGDARPGVCEGSLPATIKLDGNFDLEKVARAVLETIREPVAPETAAAAQARGDHEGAGGPWDDWDPTPITITGRKP